MTQQVLVPDVGAAEEVAVIEILVAVGDVVKKDASLIVLESDKASMEIPSPVAGTIAAIKVAVGDNVEEGDLILDLDPGSESQPAAEPEKEAEQEAEKETEQETEQEAEREAEQEAEQETEQEAEQETEKETEQETEQEAEQEAEQEEAPPQDPSKSVPVPDSDSDSTSIHAGPAVRKQAREYGVQLSAVKGSGRNGRIVKEDIQTYVATRLSDSSGGGIPPIPQIDFGKFGETELKSLPKIRQLSARNLHRSWLNVPHVTQFDEADISELEEFRKLQNAELAAQGIKLTPLAFLIKACVAALKAYPQFNSSIQPDFKNLILKKYYNIGVAVETEEGLVVPVIKAADQKGVVELARESASLAAAAREKKLSFDALQGATFTISSLGGIGGTAFTPIVNAPEVAILGVSRSKIAPAFDGETFVPRNMLPLSLSYDHRAIDGAEAARFTNYLAGILGDIRKIIL